MESLIFEGYSHLVLKDENMTIVINPFIFGNEFFCDKNYRIPNLILLTNSFFDCVGDTLNLIKNGSNNVMTDINTAISIKNDLKNINLIGCYYGCSVQIKNWKFDVITNKIYNHDSSGCGFMITTPSKKKIYIPGFTGLFSEMAAIGSLYNPDYVIFFTDPIRTMNIEEIVYSFQNYLSNCHYGFILTNSENHQNIKLSDNQSISFLRIGQIYNLHDPCIP